MWWNSVNPIKYWLSCMDQMNFWCLLFRITLWTYLGFKILRWPLWAKFGGFIHLPEPNSIFDVNSFHNLWPILDWNMQMPQADCNFYKLFVPPYVTAWMKQVAHKTWNAFKPTGLWGFFWNIDQAIYHPGVNLYLVEKPHSFGHSLSQIQSR